MKRHFVHSIISLIPLFGYHPRACPSTPSMTLFSFTATLSLILFFLISKTSCMVIHYELEDEIEEGLLIGNVGVESKLSPGQFLPSANLSGHSGGGLEFAFLESLHQNLFRLDRRTGDLVSSTRIDRDAVCRSLPECQLELNVQVKNDEISSFVKVLIKLEDANDNNPVFDRHSVQLNLSEAEVIGKKFKLARVSDDDSPKNGIKGFHLRPDIDEFAIHFINHSSAAFNSPTFCEVFLVVRKALDREKQAYYQLNLIAEDWGSPPKKAVCTISITLLDVNDNVPVFERELYTAFVEENAQVGAPVIEVTARDADLGESGDVIYGLEKRLNVAKGSRNENTIRKNLYHSLDSDDDGGISDDDLDSAWNVWEDHESGGPLFRIDRNTGSIYVASVLDRETAPEHVLSVTARDLQSPRSKSVAVVRIEVGDVNDNVPVILTQSSVYNVTENCSPRTFVALLTVTDLDSPETTRLSCSTDNPTFALEAIIDNQYQLVTSFDSDFSQIDRETHDLYHTIISCSDGGSFPDSKTGSIALEIRVLDRNDNNPIFEHSNYTARLVENHQPDEIILKVSAYDHDEGLNGLVRYKLELPRDPWYMPINRRHSNQLLSNPNYVLSHLEMDELTGALRVVSPFDREQTPVVKVIVAGYDQGSPSRTSHAHIIIVIEDVDDERPVFTKANYTFEVYENKPPGTYVGTVQAYDADEAPFNSFHYSIHRPDVFQIDPKTGVISASMALDREVKEAYVIEVHACSDSHEDDCTSAHVTVRVADENDNTPRFVFPSAHFNYTIMVTNSFQYGDRVTKILAEDDDEGPNSRIVYQALQTDYFRLNSTSGMVTAAKTFAVASDGRVCEFPVVVSDRGDPPLSAEAIITFIFNSSVKSFFEMERDGTENNNFFIVICIAITSAFLSAILVVAILLVARKQSVPPSCEVEKKTERPRNGSKKKKDSKLSSKNSGASSLKLRCQQQFPAKSVKGKGKMKKKRSNEVKDISGSTNQVSAMTFGHYNGCLKNNKQQQQLGSATLKKTEDTSHMLPAKHPPSLSHQEYLHHTTTTTAGNHFTTNDEEDYFFKENMPDIVDKVSSLQRHPNQQPQLHQIQQQQHRYFCNTINNVASVAVGAINSPSQVQQHHLNNTIPINYYNDNHHVTHHHNNLRSPSATGTPFKPEVLVKDCKYFPTCPTPVCYPNNEQKNNSFGSFV